MTTSHIKHPVRAHGPRMRQCMVSFTTVNGAAPTVNYAWGVATVARTSEGVHTITLDVTQGIPYLHVAASFKGASATDLMQIGTKTASAGTVVINTFLTAGTADDIPGAIIDVTIWYPETN